MTTTPFTDAAVAIAEAVFMAGQQGKPYAVVDVDGETMHVVQADKARGLEILEIVHP